MALHPPKDQERNVDVLSDDFEAQYLPVVGPSVVAFTRFCARRLHDGPFSIEPCELAWALGIGGRNAKSTFVRSMTRAEQYGMCDVTSPTQARMPLWVRPAYLSPKRRLFIREQFGARAVA